VLVGQEVLLRLRLLLCLLRLHFLLLHHLTWRYGVVHGVLQLRGVERILRMRWLGL